jgi:AAA family ATPase
MDGIETLKGVTVLAATNKPQNLDVALLRPGRFDELLYVAPPNLAGREAILRVRKRGMDFADDVDISILAQRTERYSGAELVAICERARKEAAAICEQTGEERQINTEQFEHAMEEVKPQIMDALVESFMKWAAGMSGNTD